MKRARQRSTHVNDAVAQPLPPITGARAADTFEALYRDTFPRVYAYVATLLRDRSAAEDVTALAFERAYRKRRGFRASRGSMEAWLFGIARNAALDELRGRRRKAVLEGDPADLDRQEPDERLDYTLRREVVRAALASLDPRERDLVALKFSGGLTNTELGQVLGMSESNAGTKLHRTVEKLRKACHDDA